MAVGAAGLQLIAQGGLVHQNVDQNGDDDGHDDPAVHLRAGEQLVQTEFGGLHAVVAGFVDIAALGVLHQVAVIAAVEHPGHQVGGDPVGHNTGQHFVDVQEGLDDTGNAAPQGARQHAAQKGDDPHQRSGHHFGGNAQRQHEGGSSAHQVLAGGADVEQAGLEGDRHRQTGEDQRGGPEEHVAHAGGVETEGQLAGGVAAGAEQAAEHQANALPRAGKAQILIAQAHHQDDDAAHGHADENGDQRGQHRFGAVLLPQFGKSSVHAPSPSFFARFAPAM